MQTKASNIMRWVGGIVLAGALLWSAPASSIAFARTAPTPAKSIYTNVDRATAALKKLVANLHADIAKVTAKRTPQRTVAVKIKSVPKSIPASVVSKPAIPTNLSVVTTGNATITPIPSPPLIPTQALNQTARGALVNILCVTKSGGSLRPISGSGVIIDPRGVILTNAHVAQYMLLENFLTQNFVSCTIRTGSPAQATYTAKLAYLPPDWIKKNAQGIKSSQSLGTGEHDFSLLVITGTTDQSKPLPVSFPYLKPAINIGIPDANYPVLLASYPAEFVGGILTQRDLYAASTDALIYQGFYYPDSDPSVLDILDVGSSVLSQGGSSGGAVVDHYDGSLLGLISTTSAGTSTAQKNLHAITMSHIDRSLRLFENKSLDDFLSGDLPTKVSNFQNGYFITEEKILEDAIIEN